MFKQIIEGFGVYLFISFVIAVILWFVMVFSVRADGFPTWLNWEVVSTPNGVQFWNFRELTAEAGNPMVQYFGRVTPCHELLIPRIGVVTLGCLAVGLIIPAAFIALAAITYCFCRSPGLEKLNY